MLDFGVDPRCIDTMSMAEITSMFGGIERRRGQTKVPSKEEMEKKKTEFLSFLEKDPSVRIV